MSIKDRQREGNTQTLQSGDSQHDGLDGTPAMSPLTRTGRDGRSNLPPKLYINPNNPGAIADPEIFDENRPYSKILIIQDRSKDRTENPDPVILGKGVHLECYARAFFKHSDAGELQFVLKPDKSPVFIKENKGMPDYLRSAIKALTSTLEPIFDEEPRMHRIGEQDLKNLLTYLGIHRFWQRQDIRQWVELRAWIDTKGQDSPCEEDLKDIRDQILSLDSYQVPTDARQTRALQFAAREELRARVHKLGSCLGFTYPIKLTPWALMYGMSLQDLEDNHKSIMRVKYHCIEFLNRVRSRLENAKARMRELGIEIVEEDS